MIRVILSWLKSFFLFIFCCTVVPQKRFRRRYRFDNFSVSKRFKEHEKRVKNLQYEISEIYRKKKPGDGVFYSRKKKACAHSPPKRANKYGTKKHRKIDLGEMDHIISIEKLSTNSNDEVKGYCVAESGVSFCDLVHETLKFGLVPKCVPELKTITLGGAISGGSIESMSFKYAGFVKSCVEMEVIDGKGNLHVVTPDDDLFHGLHASFGTIGVITQIKFELIEGAKFVKLNYVKYRTYEDYKQAIISHYEKKDIEMMDGLVQSPKEFILCVGEFCDELPKGTKPYKNFMKQAFYKRSMHFPGDLKVDYFTTEDYFFRYDSDCHWSVRNLPLFETYFFRYLFQNLLFGSSNLLKIGHRFPFMVPKRPDVICDVFVPAHNSEEFWEWYLKVFDYYPCWVVPYAVDRKGQVIQSDEMVDPQLIEGKEVLYIDFAVYGFQQKKKGVNYYRELEKKVMEMKGYKTLITHNYYTEKEFWTVFNKPFLDSLKKVYDPKNLFRDMYTKTSSV